MFVEMILRSYDLLGLASTIYWIYNIIPLRYLIVLYRDIGSIVYWWNIYIELMRSWTSGGILLFFIVEKIVRRYEELSSHSGQRALGHTHHHHQKRKDKIKKLEGPEKNAAIGEVAAIEDKESKSLESKSSDLKKVNLFDCPESNTLILK